MLCAVASAIASKSELHLNPRTVLNIYRNRPPSRIAPAGSPCRYDEGSSLVQMFGTVPTAVGILSKTEGCLAAAHGVYIRVSVYYSWIANTAGQQPIRTTTVAPITATPVQADTWCMDETLLLVDLLKSCVLGYKIGKNSLHIQSFPYVLRKSAKKAKTRKPTINAHKPRMSR